MCIQSSLYAGIYGYTRLYHKESDKYIDLIYDRHVPYKNNKQIKNISQWIDSYHPVDRSFYYIMKDLNKNSKHDIELIYESTHAYRSCGSTGLFLSDLAPKLESEIGEKVKITYADYGRFYLNCALAVFIRQSIDSIDAEMKKLNVDIRYKDDCDPFTYITSMKKQGRASILFSLSANSIVKYLKVVMLTGLNADMCALIEKHYGLAFRKSFESKCNANRDFWRVYYAQHIKKFENKSFAYFIDNGGIDMFVDIPFIAKPCRDRIPFDKISRDIFFNYQDICNIELLSHMLSHGKKQTIVYADGAHCKEVELFLKSVGFTEVSSFSYGTNNMSFLKPDQINHLKYI
jgi:hypothetical protein